MNKKFIWVWTVFTILLGALGLVSYDISTDLSLTFLLSALFGLFMIAEIIRKHKDFKLVDNTLIVKQNFKQDLNFKLENLYSWTENIFDFRGQRKRTLKLLTTEQKVIELTDKDDLSEYEILYHHLRTNHLDKKR